MILLCVSVHGWSPLVKVRGPPRSRSGGPPVKVKVQVQVGGPPGQGPGAPRSRSGGPQGQGLGGPPVKVWGPPSQGPGQGLGAPLVKVRGPPVKVWGPPGQDPGAPQVKGPGQGLGAPWSRSGGPPGQGPGQVLGPPPCQGPNMWGARVVRLLWSRRKTVLLSIFCRQKWVQHSFLMTKVNGLYDYQWSFS